MNDLCPTCHCPPVSGCVHGLITPAEGRPVGCPNVAIAQHQRRIEADWPLPPRYAAASLADERSAPSPALIQANREAGAWLARFVAGAPGPLIIQGDYGVGKTHLAAALYRACWACRREAVFAGVAQWLAALRRAIEDPAEFARLEEPWLDADLAILDDLGHQRLTEWATDQLWGLVAQRYGRQQPLVVTTNRSAAQLAQSGLPSGLIDRLTEHATIIRIQGATLRRPVGGAA